MCDCRQEWGKAMRTVFYTIVFVFLGWYALVNMTSGLVGMLGPDLPLFSQN